MAETNIVFNLQTKDGVSSSLKGLDKSLSKLSTGFKKFGKNLGSNLKGIGRSLTSIQSLAIGVGGAFAVSKLVEAANQQEDAINKLNIALKSSGLTAAGTSEDLQAFASELQSTTKFGADEELRYPNFLVDSQILCL